MFIMCSAVIELCVVEGWPIALYNHINDDNVYEQRTATVQIPVAVLVLLPFDNDTDRVKNY